MLRARTTLLASVLLAVVLLVARSAADCITHSGCSRSTYCTRVGVCAACTGCAQATTDAPQSAAASITGSCPCNATQANAAAPCTSHEECVVGAQYCDRLGACYDCRGCTLVLDGVDGLCPVWCYLVDEASTTPSSASKSTGSKGAAGMSNGGLVALLIVIVIIFILTIGVLIYFRRRWRRQEADLHSVLHLRELAQGSVRGRMASMKHKNSDVDLTPAIIHSRAQRLGRLELSDESLLRPDLYEDDTYAGHRLTLPLNDTSVVDGYEMDDALAGLESES